MPTPVQLKRNGTPGASAPSSLLHGELALNYADGKIYWKNASNVITSFTFQSYALASHTHTASAISDSTTAGRALLTAADAAAQRTSLGLGTLATQNGTFSGTSSGTNTGDEVAEYATTSAFPATGSTSLLYLATDASRAYRWTGSQYVEVGPTSLSGGSSGGSSAGSRALTFLLR